MWRLVGHLIGVEDGLLTDDWHEAERTYLRIQRHQCGASPDGTALTNTLLEFMQDYLPHHFSLNKILPPLAVVDLVGPEAAKLLPESALRVTQCPGRRALWWTVRTVLRSYSWVRNNFLRALPGCKDLFAGQLHRVSEELIESCWGAYARKPFYVPMKDDTWKLQYGASPHFVRQLTQWRRRVFNWMFVTIGSLFVGTLGAVATIVFWFLDHELGWITGLVSAAAVGFAFLCMNCVLPAVFKRRPRIEHTSRIEKPA